MRTLILVPVLLILILMLIPVIIICFLLGIDGPVFWFAKMSVSLTMKILAVKITISGREHIKAGIPYVFMANHLSFLDGPLLLWLIPRNVRVILKREIFRIPVIGQGMLLARFIPVDRKGRMTGRRSIDRAVRMIRERKYSFLIFPEGTRSRDGRLQLFKRGGFFLAVQAGVPVIPMTIKGSYELMSRGKFFVRPGRIDVRFFPPVEASNIQIEKLQPLINRVREVIEEDLIEPPQQKREGITLSAIPHTE